MTCKLTIPVEECPVGAAALLPSIPDQSITARSSQYDEDCDVSQSRMTGHTFHRSAWCYGKKAPGGWIQV